MFFDSTIQLLNKYQASLGGNPPPSYDGDLLAEVRERLHMLSLLYDKVSDTQRNIISKNHHWPNMPLQGGDATKAFLKEQTAAITEMKMYVESFYYFAARIRNILKDKDEPLPYLRSFESKGVRDVRNWLIEHPRVSGPSCGLGMPEGPKLKVARYQHQLDEIHDKGFFINASEFKDNLERVLNRAMTNAA